MITREWCVERDASDPLGALRDQFILDDSVVYLDGNSLGALSKPARRRILETVDDAWAVGLVRSWNSAGWMDAPLAVGDRLAPLIGAGPGEVLIADTITLLLAKLVGAALELRPDRHVVLTDAANFHSDLYVIDAMAEHSARPIEVRRIDRRELTEHLDEDVALVEFTHVDYRTGEMLDLAGITSAVQGAGALMLWDLAHSAGAVPVDLAAAGADLAVGCTYKYLNAGPGAPAFCFIRAALQGQLVNPLPGWLGHARPFEFERDYVPAEGVRSFQTSSPSIVSIAALEGSLEVFEMTDVEHLRAKSLALTSMFMDLVEERLAQHDLEIVTPRDPARRGSQVSLRVDGAYGLVQALVERGVIGDFRAPDIARFGFTPLTLRFVDVYDAVELMSRVLADGAHREARFERRNPVT